MAADAEIKVAGQSIYSVTTPVGGVSPEQRAATIQRNLDNALVASKDRSAAAVKIVYVKGTPVVTLGGFQVLTIDPAAASSSSTTPALLAQSFADSLKQALADSASIDSYVAQLTGAQAGAPPQRGYQMPSSGYVPRQPGAYPADYSTYNGGGPGGGPGGNYGGQYQSEPYPAGGPPPQYRGRVAYIPAGMTIPVVLKTSISTQAARAGDMVEAQINQPLNLGEATIPPGAIVTGMITQADAGRRLQRSGDLVIKFTSIRMPDGAETPISAHIAGGIGKYKQQGSDESGAVKGEGWGTKVGQFALRSAVGAGSGAALGTAIGAIAGHGRGAGRGAWSGAAIGGGLGAADDLLLRKGKDVTIQSGQVLQLQLDAPAQVSCSGAPPNPRAF